MHGAGDGHDPDVADAPVGRHRGQGRGQGRAAELVPRIFERRERGPGGTGLGLSLARTVAAADGGQVVLVRPRPAVFALFLPHGVPDTPVEPWSAARPDPAGLPARLDSAWAGRACRFAALVIIPVFVSIDQWLINFSVGGP